MLPTKHPSPFVRGLLLSTSVLLTSVLACRPGPSADDATSQTRDSSLSEIAGRVLEAYESADLVCLGELHGSVDDAALRTALVKHPGFPRTVRVIVLEFASPLHQDLLDRAILLGEPMTRDQLRPIWIDAGGGEFWENPMYEDFLRTVAAVNRSVEREQRIRIVGGAVPIPWDQVATPADLAPYLDRRKWYVQTLEREIFGPSRKGLAIYGAGHCEGVGMGIPVALPPEVRSRTYSVRSLPHRRKEARVGFLHQLGLASKTSPSWIPIQGTAHAAEPAGDIFFDGHEIAETTLGEVVDGLVDFGSPPSRAAIKMPPIEGLSAKIRHELDRRSRLRNAAQVDSAPKLSMPPGSF